MVLREVYFLISDTINNSVDLISPINGFTHKGTKATLYDLHTHENVGYIVTDIRGSSTEDNSRVRSSQSTIVIGENLKVNLPHGSKGFFNNHNFEQPTLFTGTDFNGQNTSINILLDQVKGYLSIIQ